MHELNNNAGAGDISLLLSDELPTAFTLLHAPSGTRASSATDAAGADGTGYRYTWYENDTLWSDGDQVAVAVQVAVNNPAGLRRRRDAYPHPAGEQRSRGGRGRGCDHRHGQR